MQWRIGAVTVTKIVELEVTGGSRFLLPQATYEAVLPSAGCSPISPTEGPAEDEHSRALVETPSRRIIVEPSRQ